MDLGRRRSLLLLLGALARRAGGGVSVEDLAQEVWGVDYHPARHQNRLAVAVTRLRGLIGQGTITGDKTGYRKFK